MPANDPFTFVPLHLAAPRRPRFFGGRLLVAEDLAREQDYHLHKRRLLNRLVLGTGVLTGLAVTLEGGALRVAPGVALDGLGREIVVPRCERLGLPAVQGDAPLQAEPGGAPSLRSGPPPALLLWLGYREEAADFLPMPGELEAPELAPATIIETFTLELAPIDQAPAQAGPAEAAQADATRVGDPGGTPPGAPRDEAPSDVDERAARVALACLAVGRDGRLGLVPGWEPVRIAAAAAMTLLATVLSERLGGIGSS